MAIIGRSLCCVFREPIPALCKPHAVRYALKGVCNPVYKWRILNAEKRAYLVGF
jgi:hypothetical protein